VDQKLAKKTWPKFHFASFTMCTKLTHDDGKMIFIHSCHFFFICDLLIIEAIEANDLYMATKFKFKTPFKCYGCLKIGCVFSTFKSPQCNTFNSYDAKSICIVFLNTFPPWHQFPKQVLNSSLNQIKVH
jgi:hypothetical protein